MSIITKKQILEKIENGELDFKPGLDTLQLQEHSVDLRLGFTFLIPKTWHLSPSGREIISLSSSSKDSKDLFTVVELEEGQYFELAPHEYVLASTFESITMPCDLMAILYPRSSMNRRGLSLDLAGIIDAGYEGQLILPIRNNTDSQVVRLFPGERVCQMVFEELKEPMKPYCGKFAKRDVADSVIGGNKTENKILSLGKINELKEKYAVKIKRKSEEKPAGR